MRFSNKVITVSNIRAILVTIVIHMQQRGNYIRTVGTVRVQIHLLFSQSWLFSHVENSCLNKVQKVPAYLRYQNSIKFGFLNDILALYDYFFEVILKKFSLSILASESYFHINN